MRKIPIAIAAAVLTLAGCVAPESTSVEPPTVGETKAKKSGPKTAGIGQPVKDGKFTFTVTKVQNGPRRIGDQYAGKNAQGKFIFVRVTVHNHGAEAQTFFGDAQKLLAGGKEYSADSEASIYLKDAESLLEEINPGNTVKGTIVYDVPKSVMPTAIELHDSPFSGGVKMSLRSAP